MLPRDDTVHMTEGGWWGIDSDIVVNCYAKLKQFVNPSAKSGGFVKWRLRPRP